jgi:hypothetical protein
MVGPMDVVLFHPLTVVSDTTTREREVKVSHPHEDKTEAMSLRSQRRSEADFFLFVIALPPLSQKHN